MLSGFRVCAGDGRDFGESTQQPPGQSLCHAARLQAVRGLVMPEGRGWSRGYSLACVFQVAAPQEYAKGESFF